MARAKVKLNSAGMAVLLKSDQVRSALEGPAQATLARAKADPHDDTGEYESRLGILDDTTDRAVKRVGSSARHALAVEARFGVLQRSLGG